MKVFLQVKRLWNAFTRTCLNLKHTEKKYDNIREHHGNGHSAPCPTPHCIKMFNILFKNLQIGMKVHIWIAKWFLTIQIRTIPYYWKSWLQYLLCPRIFRTTGGKVKRRYLKLYCGHKYTKSCMINRIWGLKQLWLQVNDHAWFHLHRSTELFGTERERKIQNENICLQRDWNPHHACPRQESQRLRPLGHEGLILIGGLMSYRIMRYTLIKLQRDNTCQIDYGYMCIWTECQTKRTFISYLNVDLS